MTHRRLSILALAASLVLILGLFVRGRLERTDQPPPAAPPSQAQAMQRLSHEGLLRRASSFVQERAAQAEQYVVRLPEGGGSGIRWRADSIVFATLDHRIGVTGATAGDSGKSAVRLASDSSTADWLLVVGRDRSGGLLSLPGSLGGIVRSRCDSREIEELLLNVPLTEHLAGAGVFDIDGALVGMVIRCGQRLAAIPASQIASLLARRDSSGARRARFGMSVIALDSAARAYFHTDSGVLVVAVQAGSVAAASGVRPGDVVLALDGTPVRSAAAFASDSSALPEAAHRIERVRGRERATVRLAPTLASDRSSSGSSPLGIRLAPPPAVTGVPVTSIVPGSVARAAGLREGDRITRIGATSVSSREAAERLLRSATTGLVFIAFERDSTERGVLVRP